MENTVRGTIIKGIAGFYYVDCVNAIYECHAKGIFRKDKEKPLVGDVADIEILDEEKHIGNLVAIEPRKNRLYRPEVANVDQALIVFAFSHPEPNVGLLDKFLVMLNMVDIECAIIFNKSDLADKDAMQIMEAYRNSGAKVLAISAKDKGDADRVKELLTGKCSILAGPSGVGKSTLINAVLDREAMETGDISHKLERGRHTTRHSELFRLFDNTYIMDTPGFTSFELPVTLTKEELKEHYPEFYQYEGQCHFEPCSHTHEPGCKVKEMVENGGISKIRYVGYVNIYNEIKNRRLY